MLSTINKTSLSLLLKSSVLRYQSSPLQVPEEFPKDIPRISEYLLSN